MDRKRFFFICMLLTFYLFGYGQNVVYNHFYNNPYVFNPAEVGRKNFTNVTLNQRQQWNGIEGAPQISTLTFQHPTKYKGLAFGGYINNFTRGLLTTNDVYFSVGTTAFLTKVTTLHFGLSAGVTNTSLDFNEIDDPDDPILSNFMDNNMQLTGNFGIKLSSANGLNLGISLPTLLRNDFLNTANFESYSFSPFDEVNVMLYYRRLIPERLVRKRVRGVRRRVKVENQTAPLQFYALYRYASIVDDRIEFLATLDLGDYIWVGGSYRVNYGPTGLFGIRINQVELGYAYEPANNFVSGFADGTHEIQLSINLGPRRPLVKSPPILRSLEREDKREARFSKGDIDEGGDANKSGKVFYVVLKSYKNFNAADDLVGRLREQDIETDIFYYKPKKLFYVYIFRTTKSKEANEEKRAVQELTKFKSVSIVIVEE